MGFVCPREGGIIFKSAVITCLGDRLPGGNQFFGEQQTLVIDIVSNCISGLGFEQTHHVIFADIKSGSEIIDIQVCGQISVDILKEFHNFRITVVCVNKFQLFIQGSPVQMDHEFQKEDFLVECVGVPDV